MALRDEDNYLVEFSDSETLEKKFRGTPMWGSWKKIDDKTIICTILIAEMAHNKFGAKIIKKVDKKLQQEKPAKERKHRTVKKKDLKA